MRVFQVVIPLGIVASCTLGAPLDDWLRALPDFTLRAEYTPLVQRPLQYVGFSFGGPDSELREMREAGANVAGLGEMWTPQTDPTAPFGVGLQPPPGSEMLAQSFTAAAPFDAVAPCLPTMNSDDSGCAWKLEREAAGGGFTPVADGRWDVVVNNSWPEARFPEQPAGRYRFVIQQPTGTMIGWWAGSEALYRDGQAAIGQEPFPTHSFEVRLHGGGRWLDLVPATPTHIAVPLGPTEWSRLRRFGMSGSFQVGNWNNPGFNYYPQWFVDRFPETVALDSNGQPFLGGSTLGREIVSPNIESAVIADGTRRFLLSRGRWLRDEPNLLFYVLGGESMYATYGNGRWADYCTDSLDHFRAWLTAVRYRDLAALNAAWGTAYPDVAAIAAPRTAAADARWLDWLDFRFESMGERVGWMYQALREADPRHPALTCNHGTMYNGNSYAELGARPELFAAQSDGFETGQIMTDSDPEYYNLEYIESLIGLGKPYCPVRLAYKKTDAKARGGGTSYTPAAARRYGYETLGAGAWNLGFIQWSGSLPDGEWGVKGTAGEKAIAQFMREIQGLAPILADLRAVRPAVGVFLSHPTWALQGFLPSWHALHNAAVERQIPKCYVYDGQIRAGFATDYPTLVSLDNGLVDPRVGKALLEYARQGGRLIVAGQWGGEALASGAVGRGEIVRLDPADAETLCDHLGPAARPVDVRSADTVTRPLEEETLSWHDTPADLREFASLGQTVTVARDGLQSIALLMPTYTQQPPCGFRLEVRQDGPTGALLAARDVPSDIADNAWVECALPQPPARNSVLYIAALAPPELPRTRIGWWSTAKDAYAGGCAFAAGEALAGDRRVQMRYQVPCPAARCIESFVLADGVNTAVVLVNTAPFAIATAVDLSRLLPPAQASAYTVRSCLQPNSWTGNGPRSELRLGANDAAVLYAQWNGDTDAVGALVAEARRRADAWAPLNALTPAAAYALQNATTRLAAPAMAPKAAASALAVCREIGLAVDCPPTLGAPPQSLTARCYDAAGRPLDVDRAWAEFTPTQGLTLDLERTAVGVYQLRLASADLPRLYDYGRKAYGPFAGPLRIRVAAKLGRLGSALLVDVVVK